MTCIDRSKVFTPKSWPGSKSMSTARMPKGSGHSTRGCIDRSKVNTPGNWPGQKTINPAKGVLSAKPTSGMVNANGGGDRVGAGKRTFHQNFKQGPSTIGSSSNASSNSYTPHSRSY